MCSSTGRTNRSPHATSSCPGPGTPPPLSPPANNCVSKPSSFSPPGGQGFPPLSQSETDPAPPEELLKSAFSGDSCDVRLCKRGGVCCRRRKACPVASTLLKMLKNGRRLIRHRHSGSLRRPVSYLEYDGKSLQQQQQQQQHRQQKQQ